MKKGLLLILIVLLVTGCSKLSSDNMDTTVNGIVTSKIKTNRVSNSYKYYLPLGVTHLMDYEFNGELQYKNNYLYMYVDIISYNYKNNLNFDQKGEYNYYFKSLNNNGFIGVNKLEDGRYYGTVVYNYAKIEFYSDKEDLYDTLAVSLIILSSIEYNDAAISNLINVSGSKDVLYEIDKPKDTESKFFQYLEEYVSDEDVYEKLPDE